MKTPIRQQFRPQDFKDAESAASKVDFSFQQVARQLNTVSNRQVLKVDFTNTSAFPLTLPQVRLDKVAGFLVLAAVDNGTATAPTNPPTPVQVSSVAWDKVMQGDRPAYRITTCAGLTASHRYTLTLEAVGG